MKKKQIIIIIIIIIIKLSYSLPVGIGLAPFSGNITSCDVTVVLTPYETMSKIVRKLPKIRNLFKTPCLGAIVTFAEVGRIVDGIEM